MKISPKYGTNESIVKCFWCGRVLGKHQFGHLFNYDIPDIKAPEVIPMTEYPDNIYPHCTDCQDHYKNIYVIVETEPTDNQAVFIEEGYKPTGNILEFDTLQDFVTTLVSLGYDRQTLYKAMMSDDTARIATLTTEEFTAIAGGDKHAQKAKGT